MKILALKSKKKMLWLVGLLAVGLLFTEIVLADYGHPVVSFNPNPVAITFPRAGKVVLWNVITSSSPGYFSRYYFIRQGCVVGQNCAYIDVVNQQTMETPLTVAAGETVQIKGCDCYGGNCGAGGCANPHVGWKPPHHNYFCPNYFSSNVYDPNAGGRDFTSLMNAFLTSNDIAIGGPQCWGDWDEAGSNGGYDHDFEDFVLQWAFRDTFSGWHDGPSGDVAQSNCRASGWVKQNELTGLDIRYRVLVDGTEVANGLASQFRSDLSSICVGGTCAFNHNLSSLVSPNVVHTVRVQGQNPYTLAWFDFKWNW